MVVLRNPFYSVLALVCHLLSLAVLFLLLRAEFVAAAQVVVYAGAVMVLYVFVVAYVGGERASRSTRQRRGARGCACAARAVRRARCSSSCDRDCSASGLEAIDSEGAPLRRPRLRHARPHRASCC